MKKLQKLNGKKLNKKEQQAINGGFIDPECYNNYEKDNCPSGFCWQESLDPTRCGRCVECTYE